MSSPQVWFITGSSSGFGRAVAEHVLRKGDIAVATLRTPSALADLAARYPPSRLLVLPLDVTDAAQIQAAFARALEAFGRIDVVWNNAGYTMLGETEGTPDEVARKMFEVNFWGAANVSREAVRVFRDVNSPRGGRLLQNSSVAGLQGYLLIAYYSATKFALEGLTESLITLVEPGSFNTSALDNGVKLPQHPAYATPDSASTAFRKAVETFEMPGDPEKGAERIYELAALPNPPLHLVLGADAVLTARKKAADLAREVEEYASWSDGTATVH
ncbi:predicted protein [Postia placenta Mad-698-R]|uniref:Uncharacterized protein n=1 Tax=Postia placenta MAD-698-R-SB12 TaxID=670580 RepID=A0A1X6ND61_9APHY|nr:hypothetical protein POSPLADRAFT_1178034 [Postia placenta MAD-698-R-SB12]EED79409.1 predicted protein [Postia placenta Mad-698-R]OSX66585.1 hypothetical protein POSPLADRAFT_1178034 [Postia placenta MAD-698-R-SB12]